VVALKHLLILLISFFCIALQAQKIEKETRIKANEAPPKAVHWLVNSFEAAPEITWYVETTSGKRSYEAKYKKAGKKYSVEFSDEGYVEDIEFIVKWKNLNSEVKSALKRHFEKHYTRFKIHKIQIQYTGSDTDLARVLTGNDAKEIQTRYEIEYYGKQKSEKIFWEGLFTSEGELIEKREIIQRPVDNLNY